MAEEKKESKGKKGKGKVPSLGNGQIATHEITRGMISMDGYLNKAVNNLQKTIFSKKKKK